MSVFSFAWLADVILKQMTELKTEQNTQIVDLFLYLWSPTNVV